MDFDRVWRDMALKKLANRKPRSAVGNDLMHNRRSIFMALPFSVQATNLKIARLFSSYVSSVVPINISLGWKIKPNSMRKLYQLNWPQYEEPTVRT